MRRLGASRGRVGLMLERLRDELYNICGALGPNRYRKVLVEVETAEARVAELEDGIRELGTHREGTPVITVNEAAFSTLMQIWGRKTKPDQSGEVGS